MTTTTRPGDVVDRSGVDEAARRVIERELTGVVRGEVRFDGATRGIYATDSSNYRQVPLGVVFPIDEQDVAATLEIARHHGAPVLGRGAGTSLAGQACNVAVVVDMSRHMNKILDLDPVARTARVQPGVVLDDLNAMARALDLTFGPDPATHAWCTVGGMVGNNSCGTHALYAGKTVDNVEELVVYTYEGVRMTLGACDDERYAELAAVPGDGGRIVRELRELADVYADVIANGYPTLDRRVSGYNLDQLRPDRGFHLARALVGSESTCALVTEVTVRLMPWPRRRVLVVLGYDDIYVAADDVPHLLIHDLIGLEGFDGRLVDQMRGARLHLDKLSLLPEGRGWLLCEVGADTDEDVEAKVADLVSDLGPGVRTVVLRDAMLQHRVWQIRESALGATARPAGQPVNFEGWEDAAVEPHHLGAYLRGIEELWREYGYTGAWYGHFGQGCVHTRNNFDLSSVEGLRAYRSFVERAADLCVSLGGSISGEHGDGQARGELLSRMYGPEMLSAFRRFKSIWDPTGRMNPGKLVDAYPLDTNIRYGPRYRRSTLEVNGYSFAKDGGSLQQAVERCVGVGKCRSHVDGVMCPSYRATGDERHSTRGRAKLFNELFQGETTEASWRNEDLADALSLCLSCKGCATDCPTQVDMATYKSEFMSHYYAGRLRPRSAYALGLLPWIGRVASRVPRLANAVLANRALRPVAMRAAGLTANRPVPEFSMRTLRRRAVARTATATVVVWPDTFTDLFRPERGEATIRVLEAAGERVDVPSRWACCGRTLYDSGMLNLAKSTARNVLDVLDEHLDAGRPIIVPEPSCLAAFRDEVPNLLPDDPRAARLASLSRSLSEHLVVIGWGPPPIGAGEHVAVHPHCHQLAGQATAADRQVLEACGFDVEVLDTGCCGLAGSFGYEHDDLSRQIAADRFLPALVEHGAKGLLVLDGFSCELQLDQLAGIASLSLAELIASRLVS